MKFLKLFLENLLGQIEPSEITSFSKRAFRFWGEFLTFSDAKPIGGTPEARNLCQK